MTEQAPLSQDFNDLVGEIMTRSHNRKRIDELSANLVNAPEDVQADLRDKLESLSPERLADAVRHRLTYISSQLKVVKRDEKWWLPSRRIHS